VSAQTDGAWAWDTIPTPNDLLVLRSRRSHRNGDMKDMASKHLSGSQIGRSVARDEYWYTVSHVLLSFWSICTCTQMSFISHEYPFRSYRDAESHAGSWTIQKMSMFQELWCVVVLSTEHASWGCQIFCLFSTLLDETWSFQESNVCMEHAYPSTNCIIVIKGTRCFVLKILFLGMERSFAI
jgi:hypothetical protein